MSDTEDHPLPEPQTVYTEAYRRACRIASAAQREYLAKLATRRTA